jgi:hypothetical protein
MPKAQTAPAPSTEPKTHRGARTAARKPARAPSAPAAIPEFDPTAHQAEIAETAYRIWLERTGSPEEDWRKAEIEVRSRYAQ